RPAQPVDRQFADEMQVGRFADLPVLLYRTEAGEHLFALQLKPQLADAPARPRDYLVLVDTSASKAQGPLAIAGKLADALAAQLGKDDRLALWTANLKPRDLTRGFKAKGHKDLQEALAELGREVPLGAVDLKRCLKAALDSFDARSGRQRVVLFLGDGKSVAGAGGSEEPGRGWALRGEKRGGGFFGGRWGRPGGRKTAPAGGGAPGGCAAPPPPADPAPAVVARVQKAMAEPVLYPTAFALPKEV